MMLGGIIAIRHRGSPVTSALRPLDLEPAEVDPRTVGVSAVLDAELPRVRWELRHTRGTRMPRNQVALHGRLPGHLSTGHTCEERRKPGAGDS